MLLQDNNFAVEVDGAEESQDFTVAMNGKTFRVLSSGLYKDKIGSIIREICSNAYDAHVMAGCPDRPFELHLPDQFEPWFSVKDFGIGLSPEGVKTVFTRYFESTKDNDNNTIGAFGLGAKSPFSYTDQFSVCSTYNGVLSIYSAYTKENGTPTISKMHEEPTDEPNGVEIKMSVKSSDYREFSDKAVWQLEHFKVKPQVTNAMQYFKFISVFDKIKYQGLNFDIAASGSGITIVQGNVGYPLEVDNLTGISDNQINFIAALTLVGATRIEVPIGSASVTASRESLEYTQKTIANIISVIENVKAELEQNIKDKLKDCKTNWEIAKELTSASGLTRFVNIEDVQIPGQAKILVLSGWRYGFAVPTGVRLVHHARSFYRKSNNVYACTTVAASSDFVVHIDDECKYKKSRIKAAVDTNKDLYILPENQKQELMKAFPGFNNFSKVSDLAYTPVKRTYNSAPKATFYEVNVKSYSLQKQTEVFSEYNEDEDFILVEQRNGNLVDYKNVFELEILKEFIEIPKIIAVSTAKLEKFKKEDGYVDAEKFISTAFKDLKEIITCKLNRNSLLNELNAIDYRFSAEEFKGTLVYRLAKLRSKVGYFNVRVDLLEKRGIKATKTFNLKPMILEYYKSNPILKLNTGALTHAELAAYLK